MTEYVIKKSYGNKVEALISREGTIEYAIGHFNHPSNGQFSLELKIDSFKAPVIVPGASALRVDRGERTRLYSHLGFDRTCTGCGDLITIQVMEMLDSNGDVLHTYISDEDVMIQK